MCRETNNDTQINDRNTFTEHKIPNLLVLHESKLMALQHQKTYYLPTVIISRTVTKENMFMHQLQRFVITSYHTLSVTRQQHELKRNTDNMNKVMQDKCSHRLYTA